MPVAKDFKVLNIKLRTDLWEKIDRYRFKQMFPSRTEAIEHLLDFALKAQPKREGKAAV